MGDIFWMLVVFVFSQLHLVNGMLWIFYYLLLDTAFQQFSGAVAEWSKVLSLGLSGCDIIAEVTSP